MSAGQALLPEQDIPGPAFLTFHSRASLSILKYTVNDVPHEISIPAAVAYLHNSQLPGRTSPAPRHDPRSNRKQR